MIGTSDFFEIVWVYVTFGVDYEYEKKKLKISIFDHFFDFSDLIFDPKNTRIVEKKFFLVTFVKNPPINI